MMSFVKFVLVYELGMWRSFFRWVLRRPVTSDPSARAFSYAGVVTPILAAFIGVSVIEVPILHLILPWSTIRNVVTALGVYGALWMVGLLASLRVHPHVVSDAGLWVRYGLSVDIRLPWDAIAAVRFQYRSLTGSRTVRFEESDAGRIMYLAISGQSSVDIVFRQPTTLPLSQRGRAMRSEPVTELRIYADQPEALVALAREHLAADRACRRAQPAVVEVS